MITIDAPISFLVGASLAVARRDATGRAVANRDRVLWKGLLFQSTVLTPVILFFMARFPDWEWNYFFDARAFFFDSAGPLGFAVLCAVVALVNVSFYLGFRAAEWLMARGQLRRARRVVIGTGVVILAIMGVLYDQSLHVGTFDEFGRAQGRLIFADPEFLGTLGVAGVLIAGALFWLFKSEPRVREPAEAT